MAIVHVIYRLDMTKEKRTRASEPVRNVPTRSKINSRWDENEPQNWSVSELILRLKNIFAPASLKKSVISKYRDNVV